MHRSHGTTWPSAFGLSPPAPSGTWKIKPHTCMSSDDITSDFRISRVNLRSSNFLLDSARAARSSSVPIDGCEIDVGSGRRFKAAIEFMTA